MYVFEQTLRLAYIIDQRLIKKRTRHQDQSIQSDGVITPSVAIMPNP